MRPVIAGSKYVVTQCPKACPKASVSDHTPLFTQTPLDIALFWGHLEVAIVLIQKLQARRFSFLSSAPLCFHTPSILDA